MVLCRHKKPVQAHVLIKLAQVQQQGDPLLAVVMMNLAPY